MQGIGEFALVMVAVLLVIMIGLPFFGSFLYFVFQRVRVDDEESARHHIDQRRAFKRFANRATMVFFVLFLLSSGAQYLVATEHGYISVLTVGVFGFTALDVTLSILLALGAAYSGFALAGLPLPGAKRKD
jgi:hypothetical protein